MALIFSVSVVPAPIGCLKYVYNVKIDLALVPFVRSQFGSSLGSVEFLGVNLLRGIVWCCR